MKLIHALARMGDITYYRIELSTGVTVVRDNETTEPYTVMLWDSERYSSIIHYPSLEEALHSIALDAPGVLDLDAWEIIYPRATSS